MQSFSPGLYLVATPIGHADDLSLRARDVLAAADLVLCEDTRVTSKLFALHDLSRPLAPYHDHNGAEMRPKVLKRLGQGQVIALVSDAGTPLLSDPGLKLVQAALDEGHAVTAVPGASALLAALSLAGLPTDRFFFAGFPPPKQQARRSVLASYAAIPGSLVFYESANRLAGFLEDAAGALGDRPAAVARELTKRFEEVRRDRLSALATHYAEAGPPKGEIVIVIAPPDKKAASDDEIDGLIARALEGTSLSRAVADVAAATGRPRKQVYDRALALREAQRSDEEDDTSDSGGETR